MPGRLAARVVRVDIMDSDATFTTDGNTRALRSDHVPLLLLEITRYSCTMVPMRIVMHDPSMSDVTMHVSDRDTVV